MEKQKHDLSLMSLHVNDVIGLFVYYIVLLLSSLGFLIFQIIQSPVLSQVGQFQAVASVISASISGSTIFYSRKLYKAAINSSYQFLSDNNFPPARVGTLFFFILRPIFGAVFALIVYALWRASVHASTEGGSTPKEFIFVVIPIGFLSGFSAGRLIEKFEDRSVNDLLGNDDER